MVGGFAVTMGFRILIVSLMALIAIIPFVFVSAAVWLVFFKLHVTIYQFAAVCLLQFVAYFFFSIFMQCKSDPPVRHEVR